MKENGVELTHTTEPTYIVTIGASAGGLTAISELMSQVKQDINAAFLVVMHLSRKGISDFLLHRIQQFCKLQCHVAAEGMLLEQGHVYIAPPNYHLLVKDDKLKLGHGPEENRWRPSIDVLFRSAAAQYNGRTIGVVLTGLLDDGTIGMLAIKKCGGRCIVQDPNEAEYPDMPLSVLNNMEVDHCLSIQEMGKVLTDMTYHHKPVETSIPPEIKAEAEIAERVAAGIQSMNTLGEDSVYSCPDCGGHLWKITDNKMDRYRCHVGHSYSERDLNIKQAEEVEATLWIALRIMEERKNLLKKMENDTRNRGYARIASDHEQRRDELQGHIDHLRALLVATQNADHT